MLDNTLKGGISVESVNLIYGEPETGKTTMAMQCAINCALRGSKTLFVDCDGTFSAERLSQIAGNDFERISDLVVLMKPNDFREQTMIIDHSSDYVTEHFGLIVFDTVTSLYRAEVSDSPARTFGLNRELNRQLACLAQTAKLSKIAMLLTSQVRAVFEKENVSIEPVASRVLKFWSDTVINLKLTQDQRLIDAILEKPKAQKPFCHLKIEKSGIVEYAG